MHMLVENATSPWGQSWERIFHKHSCIHFIALVPRALVQWPVCTCACGKPFPKIIPMVKLDKSYFNSESVQLCLFFVSCLNEPSISKPQNNPSCSLPYSIAPCIQVCTKDMIVQCHMMSHDWEFEFPLSLLQCSAETPQKRTASLASYIL